MFGLALTGSLPFLVGTCKLPAQLPQEGGFTWPGKRKESRGQDEAADGQRSSAELLLLKAGLESVCSKDLCLAISAPKRTTFPARQLFLFGSAGSQGSRGMAVSIFFSSHNVGYRSLGM